MKHITNFALSTRMIAPTSVLLSGILLCYTPALAMPSVPLQKEYAIPTPRFIEQQFIIPTQHTLRSVDLLRTENYFPLPQDHSSIPGANLDGFDGIKGYKANIVGDIVTLEDSKLVSLKEGTVTGNISLSGGKNTVMIVYSTLGTKKEDTIEFVDTINGEERKHTVTITSGTEGSITTGAGDDVVWIGGAAKEGFAVDGGYWDGPSTVFGGLNLGDGNNELKVYGRSQVQGNIRLGAGDDSVTINNSTLGLIVRNYFTNDVYTLSGGTLNVGDGKNTLDIERAEIAGDVISGIGDDSISIKNSTIHGSASISGGKNTINFEYTDIINGITISGNGDNSIEIRSGFIGTRKKYDSTVPAIYKDINLGTGKNTLTMLYTEFGGNITGNGSITFDSSSTWKGDHTIVAGQDVLVKNYATLDGNFTLANDSVTLQLVAGTVNGILSGKGNVIVGKEDTEENKGGTTTSYINDDIRGIQLLEIQKDAVLVLNSLTVDTEDTTNPNHTIRPENPITRTIQADTIALGGDIILHPGVTKDILSIDGAIQANGGSFVLDMNFEEATADTLDLTQATIANSTDNNAIVYFVPQKPLYYATLGTTIEGVVLGADSLNIGLSQSDVGGYEYELILNPNNTQWDLRLVRISASNYAYAGIIENMRNYTKDVWTNISDHLVQSLVGDTARSISVLSNTTGLPKVMDYGYVNTWALVNYNSNTIYAPDAPTIEENSFTATAGIGINKLTIGDTDSFSIDAFFTYGATDSKLMQYNRNHTMSMNALTVGIKSTWQNFRLGEKHTTFLTLGYWADFLSNEVNLEGLDSKTQWETYAMNALVSFGYKLQESNVTFIASLDGIYTFTKGEKFITKSMNAIDIEDDNRFGMRINTLVGYSLNFGLTPFFQLYVDIPVVSSTKGLISSNGHGFSYDSEKISTSFKFGLNYSITVGETNITAFIAGGGQKGQPDSSVEVGWSASGGISIEF